MPKNYLIGAGILVVVLIIFGFIFKLSFLSRKSTPTPTPTLGFAQQLPAEKQPKVSLEFSPDAHYVTVNITNIFSDQLEYNLIYDATVKGNKIQTGVNASAKLDGKSEYSYKQLLGSESSGKFTYHSKIENAVMELTLRDSANRSIFTASYPFTVSLGESISLQPSN